MNKGVSITVIVILSIIGFILLIRSCLASHDEYSQFDEAQWFNTSEGKVIVYLKKYFKVNSYSSENGMTHISGSTRYFLETRDAESLKFIKKTKFAEIDDYTRNIPKIIGKDDNNLWIFHDSIICYNPYNHSVVCSNYTLSSINPEFIENIPNEKRYILFDYTENKLQIMLKNGQKYWVDPTTFKASKFIEQPKQSPVIEHFNRLKDSIEIERRNYIKSRQYDIWTKLQDSINIINDSIYKIKNLWDLNQKTKTEIQNILTGGFSDNRELTYTGIIHNNFVYALLSEKEHSETTRNYYINKGNYTEALRQIYKAQITKNFGSYFEIGNFELQSQDTYLNSAFLMNKDNLKTIELYEPYSWLIISSKEIGNKSPLIIQRVEPTGKNLWKNEIPFNSFTEMLFNGSNIIFFSNDGEKITGNSDCSIMLSINVNTGQSVLLDLFTEKER